MRMPRLRLALAAVVSLSVIVASAQVADAATTRNYASWTVNGSTGAFAGSLGFGPVAFPTATISSDAQTFSVASSATLTGSTPFGQAFGTSSGKQYASIGATGGGAPPASTTFTFGGSTPNSGWGFALGDIDAEYVRVSAVGLDGQPVAIASLGFEGTFNYTSSGTDVPTWDSTTGTLAGGQCPSVCNTDGASAWFRPSVPLRSLTLDFSVQAGIPLFQVWVAANATEVTGSITYPPAPVDPPTGPVTLEVLDPSGQEVAEISTTEPEFVLPPLVEGPEYTVVVTPPPGWELTTPARVPLPTASGSPAPLAIGLRPVSVAPPTVPSTTPTTTAAPPTASAPRPLALAG